MQDEALAQRSEICAVEQHQALLDVFGREDVAVDSVMLAAAALAAASAPGDDAARFTAALGALPVEKGIRHHDFYTLAEEAVSSVAFARARGGDPCVKCGGFPVQRSSCPGCKDRYRQGETARHIALRALRRALMSGGLGTFLSDLLGAD